MHCGSAEDVRELVAAASTLALNKPSVIAIQFSEEFEDKCKVCLLLKPWYFEAFFTASQILWNVRQE